MTTELENQINQLKEAISAEIQTLKDKVEALTTKDCENQLLSIVLEQIGSSQKVRESAENAGLSVENFIAEAVMTAMDGRKSIPVDIEVYERLEARASGKGLSIEQLFGRSSFQEFILDGLQRGAF